MISNEMMVTVLMCLLLDVHIDECGYMLQTSSVENEKLICVCVYLYIIFM